MEFLSHLLLDVLLGKFVAVAVHLKFELGYDLQSLPGLVLTLLYPFFHDELVLFLSQLARPAFQPVVVILYDFEGSGPTPKLLLQHPNLVVDGLMLFAGLLLQKHHVFVYQLIQLLVKFADHISHLLVHPAYSIDRQ
jgi:hypothetical protein